MNVYVREVSRELGRRGFSVDVFTRCQNGAVPKVVPLGDGARVIHLDAGPCGPLPREDVFRHLPAFVERVEAFRRSEGMTYDLIHSHYWLSGWVGLRLRHRWGIPVIQMFHTLARLKNRALGGEREPELRVRAEARRISA
jgi:D-inositol-3-phosphate glycosyltransferase